MVLLFTMLSSTAISAFGSETPTIADSCYHPHGKGCKWYEYCLEKRHPCPKDNYALKYAKYFCDKYGDAYSQFSEKGKEWIDGVRLCLQNSLVPMLHENITCAEMKREAFDAHVCCYLATCDHTKQKMSICDVPFPDWLKAFWVIREAFDVFGQHAEVMKSLKTVLNVMSGCIFRYQ